MLVGAAATLRTVIGAPLPPADQDKLDRMVAPARAALGDAAAVVTRRGESLALNEALDFALTH